MKYKKRPKRKYATYWKETAGFDCQKELQIYKFLCGRRMRHKSEVKYCFTRKEDWKKYVYSQYADRSVEQLQNFLFYLEQAKRDVKDGEKVTVNYMLPISAALIAGCLVPETIKWMNLSEDIESVLLVVGLVVLILWILGMIYNAIKSVFDNSDKKYFYDDYMEIIAEIIRKKRM